MAWVASSQGENSVHPRKQLPELQKCLQKLGRTRADVVIVGVLKSDERNDVVGVLDSVKPFPDFRKLAGHERHVPGHHVAGEVDVELPDARIGERARFVVGKPEAKLRRGSAVGSGRARLVRAGRAGRAVRRECAPRREEAPESKARQQHDEAPWNGSREHSPGYHYSQ